MTYTFKLARRLAVSRGLGLLAVLVLAACAADETDPTSPPPVGDAASGALALTPEAPTTLTHHTVRFAAYTESEAGERTPVAVQWQASGGTIDPDGYFQASQPGTYQVIARDAAGAERADTARVTVLHARLVVSPDTVTVELTEDQTFAAALETGDGAVTPVAVSWSASGGTIDGSGLFTAGSTAGTYRVIAAESSGTLVDSAVVIVAAPSESPAPTPPPPDGAFPHAPDGATVITDREFASIVEDQWTADRVERFSITPDPGAPGSDGMVGRVLYPQGFEGGHEPAVISRTLPGTDTLYLSFWVKLSENFYGHPGSGVNKIFHIWIAGRNRVYLSAQGGGDGPLTPQVRLQDIVSHDGYVNLTPNVNSAARIVRGQWQRWELMLVSNSDGKANGTVEWWIDGERAGFYSDIAFVDASEPRGWSLINLAPTWGGMYDTVPADQYLYVDHVHLSGN